MNMMDVLIQKKIKKHTLELQGLHIISKKAKLIGSNHKINTINEAMVRV